MAEIDSVPATGDRYDRIAGLMKILSHPVRLQILDVLRRRAECVCHLETVVHKPQPYISQQLALLRSEGLVSDRKEGQNVYYRVSDPEIMALLAVVLDPVPANGQALGPLAGCPCPRCSAVAPIQLH
jgi:ArsR family transcriptional regulator